MFKGFRVYLVSEPTRFPFFNPSGTLESAIDETTDEITIATGPDCNLVESVNEFRTARRTPAPKSLLTRRYVSERRRTLSV